MFKVLTEGCQPTRGSKYSACVDLYAAHDCVIGAGETKLVGLGVAIEMEAIYARVISEYENLNNYEEAQAKFEYFLNSHYLQLMLRSSIGKKGLILANGVGVIDLDYKDEIKMIVHNPLKEVFIVECPGSYKGFDAYNGECVTIKKGDKIAQITLLEHKSHMFGIETDNERSGGFGSTGG
jgi:dUTP pyrophosphatase